MAEIVATDRGRTRIGGIRRFVRDVAWVLLLGGGLAATTGWLAHHHGAISASALAERAAGKAHDHAEHAIYIGGILLERNRHVIAGAVLGCAAGASIGVGAAAVVGLVTAGAGFAAIPAAAAAGCGLAGLGGAAIGRPLDDYVDF